MVTFIPRDNHLLMFNEYKFNYRHAVLLLQLLLFTYGVVVDIQSMRKTDTFSNLRVVLDMVLPMRFPILGVPGKYFWS